MKKVNTLEQDFKNNHTQGINQKIDEIRHYLTNLKTELKDQDNSLNLEFEDRREALESYIDYETASC